MLESPTSRTHDYSSFLSFLSWNTYVGLYIKHIAFICFPFMYYIMLRYHIPISLLFSMKFSSIINLSALGIFDWPLAYGQSDTPPFNLEYNLNYPWYINRTEMSTKFCSCIFILIHDTLYICMYIYITIITANLKFIFSLLEKLLVQRKCVIYCWAKGLRDIPF